jgi:pimeloyl-ACP methyl ester carboxylesterase
VAEIIGRYVEVNGFRTYYESAGDGIPIVCLHTAGADGREYRHFLEHFSRTYRAIALDMPGHGKSYPDLETGRLISNGQEYVDFVWAFVEQLGLDRPILVGCAMSGNMVLKLAAQRSDHIRAVVSAEGVADTSPVVNPLFVEMLNHPQINVADFMEAQTVGLCGRRIPRAALNECIWHNARALTPEVVQGDIVGGYLTHNITDQLSSIRVPVLLTHGRYDWVVTPTQVQATLDGISTATVVELEEVGHFPMIEDPDRFNEEVEKFLRQVLRPS